MTNNILDTVAQVLTAAKNSWSLDEVKSIYNLPLFELIYQSISVHKTHNEPGHVQKCTLLSIKTGNCSENCSYCPQSAHYETKVESTSLLSLDEVITAATAASANGSSRFCMGAAWRQVNDNQDFDNVLAMVTAVSNLGLEVCCTLGMLNENQALKLKEAGLTAYNHNLDTSENFYENIITTRTYKDRLNTLTNVRKAGITVCCGGILGLGESHEDRIELLHTLANLNPQPESVPINTLVRVEGTPLSNNTAVAIWDMLRMIATARILMPQAKVRLSAGRSEMTASEQALCFLAGANSIFMGDKLLTTPNVEEDLDNELFMALGLS